MSRQKKSKGLPPWLITLLFLIVAGAAYFSLHQNFGDSSMRTVEALDPDLYYNEANSLRGNTYKIHVQIDSSLGDSPTRGRLFSVLLDSSDPARGAEILPILVPPELGSLTIQKGQNYLMKVQVVENGLLKVREAVKP